jgi:hypothetical protein
VERSLLSFRLYKLSGATAREEKGETFSCCKNTDLFSFWNKITRYSYEDLHSFAEDSLFLQQIKEQ